MPIMLNDGSNVVQRIDLAMYIGSIIVFDVYPEELGGLPHQLSGKIIGISSRIRNNS
jgi:hypothetical protein